MKVLAVTFLAVPETYHGASHEATDRTGDEQQYPVIPNGLSPDMQISAGRYC